MFTVIKNVKIIKLNESENKLKKTRVFKLLVFLYNDKRLAISVVKKRKKKAYR